MGKKVILDKQDNFLDDDETNIAGIVGCCYCCSQNIHVTFNHLETAPVAQIEDSFFYVVICDQCEDDIDTLVDNGVEKVSYDVLWLIQENLSAEVSNFNKKNGIVDLDPDKRDSVLVKLYREAEKKMDNMTVSKYLNKIAYSGDKDSKN